PRTNPGGRVHSLTATRSVDHTYAREPPALPAPQLRVSPQVAGAQGHGETLRVAKHRAVRVPKSQMDPFWPFGQGIGADGERERLDSLASVEVQRALGNL